MRKIAVFKSGQALVLLIVVMVVGTIITSAAIIFAIVNLQAGSDLQSGEEAYAIAESGAENGILRLVRNPAYTGETLTVGSGQAVITVSGSGSLTIVSTGVMGNFRRKVEVKGNYVNNIFTVSTWKEIN